MSARDLCRRLWMALRARSADIYTNEHLTFLAKTSELEARIKCLECKTYGPNGIDDRLRTIERRQHDDPNYDGAERRRDRLSHISH